MLNEWEWFMPKPKNLKCSSALLIQISLYGLSSALEVASFDSSEGLPRSLKAVMGERVLHV